MDARLIEEVKYATNLVRRRHPGLSIQEQIHWVEAYMRFRHGLPTKFKIDEIGHPIVRNGKVQERDDK